MAIHKLIPIFLLLLLGFSVSARQLPKINFPLTGRALMSFSGEAIDFSADVKVPDPNQQKSAERIFTFQNTVELALKNHSAFNPNAKVTVTADLKYYPAKGSLTPVTKTIKLEINYKSGALTKSNISGIYAFANAWKVELKITNVEVTSDSGVDLTALKTKLAEFIELNIGFQEERLTRIQYNVFPSGLSVCDDEVSDELVINWDPATDAEEYELEYTFEEDYSDSYNVPVNPSNILFNFRENSTRISLKETSYRVPLIFERGWILYRVRAIGRGGNNLELPVYCTWSGAEHGVVSAFGSKYYHGKSHTADNVNWQSSSTFAEDGKRSDKVSYSDGTFRKRQTVTGVNLDPQLPDDQSLFGASECFQPQSEKQREVLAGETIYDYQGRPAVNILPAPTNSHKIDYLPLLNISNSSQKPYDWSDFDKPNFTCPGTNPLSSLPDASTGVMGAAAYYSPNNQNKLGFNAFIPHAAGFPFTQQSYLQDNTGRVAAQAGVGPAFQFGHGKESRFYFASPNQEELDRMFGTEVGDALRYKKNAVMDQNGQLTVSYLNPEGKTIATALAGKTPTYLDPLDNQASSDIDISLMSKNITNTVDKTLITEHQFLVTSDNTKYSFDYSINPDTVKAEICTGFTVCLDCIYDIDISLNHVESCTVTPLAYYSGTIGNLFNNTGQTDLNCENSSNTGNYPRNITRILGIGTYVITKKITVNRQAALAYVAEVFKDTCKAKWNDILHDEFSRVDTLDCYRSCATCAQPPVITPVCDTTYCKPNPNRCDNIRAMMLADISPGGQYGQFVRNADGSIDASTFPLSIFNPNNVLPTPFANALLLPAAFTTIRDLVNNWLPEYAAKLLPLHPEYCMLGWCDSPLIDATLDFDTRILSTEHFADAVTNSFITQGSVLPNSSVRPFEQLLNQDPWFLNNANPVLRTALLNKLWNYGCSSTIAADEIAMQMAYCARNNPPPNQQGSTPVMNASGAACSLPANYLGNHAFGTGSDPALTDLEWTFLRAMYLSAKNEVLQSSMNSYADSKPCNSRCVGVKDYYDWGQFYVGSSGFASMHNYAPCQSLSTPYVWMLYKHKQSRFGSGVENILNVMSDAGISVNISGVTNFDDLCQFGQAIAGQSSDINQQVANTLCGGGSVTSTDTICKNAKSKSLIDLFNSIIVSLRTNTTVALTSSQIPASMSSMGITGAHGYHGGDARNGWIRIDIDPCIELEIPYLKGLAPLSVCCITNFNCTGAGNTGPCSFDMNVLYPIDPPKSIHVITKCNLLSGCKVITTSVCSQLSPYATAVEEYLSDIFNFITTYQINPTPGQLINMLPSVLRGIGARGIHAVTLMTTPDFTIDLIYHDPRGADRHCKINLQNNPATGTWNNVKNIISIAPDLTLAQGGITQDFVLKVLAGTNLSNLVTVSVKGHADCQAINQCTPSHTLCDSIPVMPPYPYVNNCVRDLMATAYSNTSIRYNAWQDSMKNDLLQRYFAKCLKSLESFTMKYTERQYQYTLYYYDQAGNLVKTVPPAGVKLLDHTQALLVDISRKAGYTPAVLPSHFKTTEYRYNTLNQSIWQQTPDAGESNFFYDGLGRIVASQNAQQKPDDDFAYTRYDLLGRSVESGKVKSPLINAQFTRNFNNWIGFLNAQPSRTEIKLSRYDEPFLPVISQKFGPSGQQNLRMRVASAFSFETAAKLNNKEYTYATHYTYDIEGNVYKLIQDYPNGILGDKAIEYDYDLQSGKVNQVTYQLGAEDQFIHHYSYDAANRLTQVKTSTNGVVWETDGEYKYYRHGPLARLELGTDKVQGLDYMYTLQGWIKGVNGTTDTTRTDMGQDGIIAPATQTSQGSYQLITLHGITFSLYTAAVQFGTGFNGPGYGAMNNPVARDAFGYVLDYFPSDYTAIQGNSCLAGLQQTSGTVKPLYNGNISRMYTQIQSLGNNGCNYTYDQLNRITSQHAWKISGNSMSMLPDDAYGGVFRYDADGNFKKHLQNGTVPTPAMDDLDYFYYDTNLGTFNPALGMPINATNKLAYVKDNVPATSLPEDIEDQSSNPLNYKYNAIGNLISDDSEKIKEIDWNLQNKITQIIKANGPNLKFAYDPFGNRVMKDVTGGSSIQNAQTFYVRDAIGNIMAVYAFKIPRTGGTEQKLHWSEVPLYGSSRLGIYAPDTVLTSGTVNTTDIYLSASRGFKQYELSNHLGNVLATISDRKISITANGAITYRADLLNGQDYYAFGMQMPGRNISNRTYRFGFGSQEKNDEIEGNGNSYNAEYWQYDTRLGKRWDIDPITKSWESPYSTFSNSPIWFNDPLGLDPTTGGGEDKKISADNPPLSKAPPPNPKEGDLWNYPAEDHSSQYIYQNNKWESTGQMSANLKQVEISIKGDPSFLEKIGNTLLKAGKIIAGTWNGTGGIWEGWGNGKNFSEGTQTIGKVFGSLSSKELNEIIEPILGAMPGSTKPKAEAPDVRDPQTFAETIFDWAGKIVEIIGLKSTIIKSNAKAVLDKNNSADQKIIAKFQTLKYNCEERFIHFDQSTGRYYDDGKNGTFVLHEPHTTSE